MKIDNQYKNKIIDLIKNGEELPIELKDILFPSKGSNYEFTYAEKKRKEDVIAYTEDYPLQLNKIFNGNEYKGFEDGWKNMIVFGDNLQFLKTLYADKDDLIAGKVKGKVKLIYIDPPFATKSDFTTKNGDKAYADKRKAVEFVEFIRRRLIIAKELLAEDGTIVVHLDNKNHTI